MTEELNVPATAKIGGAQPKPDPGPVRVTWGKKKRLEFKDRDIDERSRRTTGIPDPDAGLGLITNAGQITAAADETAACRNLNNAAARMHGLAPSDTMEGMTAALLVAVQDAAFVALQGATLSTDSRTKSLAGARAERLLRSFVSLADLRLRLRGGGTNQRVTVEHVTVTAGGQAVIGLVTPGGAGGDAMETSKAPHAQT